MGSIRLSPRDCPVARLLYGRSYACLSRGWFRRHASFHSAALDSLRLFCWGTGVDCAHSDTFLPKRHGGSTAADEKHHVFASGNLRMHMGFFDRWAGTSLPCACNSAMCLCKADTVRRKFP
jgi:hypothetical protein